MKSPSMPYTCGNDIERTVNATLREAMTAERCKHWPQVVRAYRRLLRMLVPENLPPEAQKARWMSMLMYEVHYHLAVALQHGGENAKAARHLTQAIEAVSVSKNGCLAGCHTNSCLMTPIHARRACAFAQSGDLRSATRDAEKAVVMDSKNADVYCIRALVMNGKGQQKQALEDVEKALRYNPNHLCALILRGGLISHERRDDWGVLEAKPTIPPDHKKACDVNPDCQNYLEVKDCNHSDFSNFFDRFLYSLGVPHTISAIHIPQCTTNKPRIRSASSTRDSVITDSIPRRRCMSASTTRGRFTPGSVNDNQPRAMGRNDSNVTEKTSLSFLRDNLWPNDPLPAFRCGTPHHYAHAPDSQRRRQQYGEAVRKHVTKPRTAEEYLAQMQKDYTKRAYEKQQPGKDVTLLRGVTPADTNALLAQQILVFQSVKVGEVPRMYYRPWSGDKLPVADVERKTEGVVPFKV